MADPAQIDFSDLIPATAKSANPGGIDFSDLIPAQQSATADVVKSVPSGLAKGAADLVGLPGALANGVDWAVRHAPALWSGHVISDEEAAAQDAQRTPLPPSIFDASNAAKKAIEAIPGVNYQPATTPGKFVHTAAEFVPGALAGPEGIAQNAIRYGVIPGLASEAAGEATQGTPYEPAARVAGALLAPAGVAAARRAVTPFPITPERQAMVDTLTGEGVPLTAGQVSGSRPLRYMESAAGDVLGSGGRVRDIEEAQQGAFTAAALRRMGSTADRATPEVMQDAADRIGGTFDQLGARNTMQVDPQLGQDLGGVMRDYAQLLPSERREQVANVIGDIMGQPGQQMAGPAYQIARSRLTKASQSTRASDPQFSQALGGVRDALDDAMGRSVADPADQAAWQEARQQWGAMKLLERASTGAGENAASGLISPSALRNATAVRDRTAYARGQGDFADLARAGEGVMKPMPQSGTSPRQHAMHLLQALSTGVGAHGGGMEGGILGALAPAAAGRALMSGPVQSYLRNQLLSGVAPGAQTGMLAQLLAANPTIEGMLPDQRR